MEFKQPSVSSLKNDSRGLHFQCYLEGVEVPFTQIDLVESEQGHPSAQLTFPAISGALRVLPSTIVQVFGPAEIEKDDVKQPGLILLFEGEVVGVAYQKTSSGRMVTIQAESLLNQFESASVTPVDMLVPQSMSTAMGLNDTKTSVKVWSVGGTTSLDETGPIANLQSALAVSAGGDSEWAGSLISSINIMEGYGGIAATINKIIGKPETIAGDNFQLFHLLNAFYEVYDMFYGVLSRSYGLTSSILAMPNKLASGGQPFKTELMQAMLMNLKSTTGSPTIGMPEEYTLMQYFATVLNLLQFRMLRPSTYTRTHRFFQTEKDIGPVRAIIVPELDTQPPALCNIFFPDQVSTFSYSRQMKNEITRVVTQGKWGYFGNNNQFTPLFPIYVAPNVNISISKKDNTKIQTGITTEESFRGIQPYYHQQSGPFVSAIANAKKGSDSDDKDMVKKFSTKVRSQTNFENDIGDVFAQITAGEYIKRKYAGRGVTLDCEWSPYRAIGFPALFLDSDSPSIMGVISSIQTSISATGIATSTVTLRSAKIIHDNEFNQSPFSSDVSEQETMLQQNVMSDFILDSDYLFTNLLYDNRLYSPFLIGLDAYTYLLYGEGHRRNGLKTAADEIKSKSKAETAWDLLADSEDPNGDDILPHSSRIDNSIFYFIRKSWEDTTATWEATMSDLEENADKQVVENSTGTNTLNSPAGFEEFYSSTNPGHQSIKYTLQLYHAVQQARLQYKHFKDGNAVGLQAFVKNINWRPLLSKAEYFNSIGVEGEPGIDHVKDSKAIFKDVNTVKDYVVEIKEQEAKIFKQLNTLKGRIKGNQWWVDILMMAKENWTGSGVEEWLATQWLAQGPYGTDGELGWAADGAQFVVNPMVSVGQSDPTMGLGSMYGVDVTVHGGVQGDAVDAGVQSTNMGLYRAACLAFGSKWNTVAISYLQKGDWLTIGQPLVDAYNAMAIFYDGMTYTPSMFGTAKYPPEHIALDDVKAYGPFDPAFGFTIETTAGVSYQGKSKKNYPSFKSEMGFTVIARDVFKNIRFGIEGLKTRNEALISELGGETRAAESEYEKLKMGRLDAYSLFRPYDLTRVAHVREGFSNFIGQKDKKVIVTN